MLSLPFIEGIGRADRDNAIDVYISDEYEDVLRDGEWQKRFTVCPPVFTAQEKRDWLSNAKDKIPNLHEVFFHNLLLNEHKMNRLRNTLAIYRSRFGMFLFFF